MICDHESLEEDSSSVAAVAGRRQVVRWRRSFPFAFLSDREYCIARRCWRCPDDPEGCIYTATKTVAGHPRMAEIQRAREDKGGEKVVQMDVFYSVWRSRTVPCPSGLPGAPPACETLLLHREDFKIPENLARFAVKAGMAGFVKKMAPAVRAFVKERRARGVAPRDHDARAYGVPEAWSAALAAAAKGEKRGASPLPPPPEAATFFALGEGEEEEEEERGGNGAAALPCSSFASAAAAAAAARPSSTPATKAATSLRGSVSFAQLPPSFSVSRRASQEGMELAKRVPASFALSATASEESEEHQQQRSSASRELLLPQQQPRLRRAAVSAPQLSSLGSMLASAAQDFADMLPARVGRAVGAALGSPLLGNSPPETPKKGGQGEEEEGEGSEGAGAASATADPSSSSVRSASPAPSHHLQHRPSSSHHHHHHHPHHHHVGRGRRRGPPGGRARSPQAHSGAAAAVGAAPAENAHHHGHGIGGSLPLAADLLRAGVAVAVAVAVASRTGKAAGRAEARAELAKLRKRHEEGEGEAVSAGKR